MKISDFEFPIYVTLIIVSLIAGIVYIYISLKKEKEWNNLIWLYFILGIYMALVCGKLFTMLIFLNHKVDFISIGLTSYGGAIGLVGASLIFELIVKLNGKLFKYSILSLPLIYGIAKIGCFLAGCCYGIPYSGIFSVIYVDNDINISLFPIQLLESLTFITIFIVLNKIKNNKNIIYISIITMSVCKFLLDFLRYENYTEGFSTNQGVSVLILIITLITWIYINKKKKLKT